MVRSKPNRNTHLASLLERSANKKSKRKLFGLVHGVAKPYGLEVDEWMFCGGGATGFDNLVDSHMSLSFRDKYLMLHLEGS